MKSKALTVLLLTGLLVFGVTNRVNTQENALLDTDKLVYSVFDYDNGTSLYLYDTDSGENTMVHHEDGRLRFVFGSNGIIAFSTGWTWENNGEIFILDTNKPNLSTISLTSEINMVGYPLGWSIDGNYLAFTSGHDNGQQSIYIWDGQSVIDITPTDVIANPQSFDIAWGVNEQLAFTVWFGNSNLDPRSEIYLWDGESTVNLSQDENAEDRQPVWNSDGEIVFGSTNDNEYILLWWDGTSYIEGVPDTSTFTRIAPQLTVVSPFSVWFDNDQLVFEAYDTQDTHSQIYSWDKLDISNLSRNPNSDNAVPQISTDGYWAFNAFSSDSFHLYVRDENNETIFQKRGHGSPAWSSGGSLMLCGRDGNGGWKLSIWNRSTLSTLTQGDEIFAQWRSGHMSVCSDG